MHPRVCTHTHKNARVHTHTHKLSRIGIYRSEFGPTHTSTCTHMHTHPQTRTLKVEPENAEYIAVNSVPGWKLLRQWDQLDIHDLVGRLRKAATALVAGAGPGADVSNGQPDGSAILKKPNSMQWALGLLAAVTAVAVEVFLRRRAIGR